MFADRAKIIIKSGKGGDGHGNWTHKERFSDINTIGIHIDKHTGMESKTKGGTIVYSKTGTHVYPRKDE